MQTLDRILKHMAHTVLADSKAVLKCIICMVFFWLDTQFEDVEVGAIQPGKGHNYKAHHTYVAGTTQSSVEMFCTNGIF